MYFFLFALLFWLLIFLVFVYLTIYISVFFLEIKNVCEIEWLELSNNTDNKLIKNNNYAAKIDVLNSTVLIFAEITWIINYYMLIMNDNHVTKLASWTQQFQSLQKSCELLIIICWSWMIIMLQKLTSWIQQLQFLWKSHELQLWHKFWCFWIWLIFAKIEIIEFKTSIFAA